jgi:hypothetical protein
VPVLVLSNLVDAADALGCEAIGFWWNCLWRSSFIYAL